MRHALAALAAFVLLAVLHTWPLAADPAHLSRNDNADAQLNEWAIAWVAHQLPRDPIHLFDANIFYPDRHTLAYSEAMIVQGVLAMPVFAAGASPVLAYNVVLIAGFALTGWSFWLLIRRWTGSTAAAYAAGSLAAFNSHVLVRLPHLQTQHVEFVALAMFGLDRVLRSSRARDAVLLAAGFALQGLTSVYLLVFTTWMLMFAALSRAREWIGPGRRRALLALAAAGALALVALAPYVLAYVEVRRAEGFERSVEVTRHYAGSWRDYLASGSRLHYRWWSQPFVERANSDLFPGVTATLLVVLAFAWREDRRDPRFVMSAAAGVGCAAVGIVPNASFYPTLYRLVPLFHAVRVSAHVGQIVLLMIAVAAGFGLAGMLRRIDGSRRRTVVAVAAFVMVNGEALRAPFDYEPFRGIPPIYDRLRGERNAVILEVPMWPPPVWFGNGTYMVNSTRHWKPMLNGYSGFRPQAYDDLYAQLGEFPDAPSLSAVRARGVTHIVLHRDLVSQSRVDAMAHFASLQLIATDGTIEIYRLR